DDLIWPVPLFSNHDELPKRLDKRETVTQLKSSEPLLIDQGAAGHYIVHYADPEHRTAIEKLVSGQKLDTPDRLMLLNSASMLARGGVQPFGDVLKFLSAYETEQSEPVWDIMTLVAGESKRFIDLDETLEPKIKQF